MDFNTNGSGTQHCPLQHALDKISGKWKIPILWELNLSGEMRFNELKKKVEGITNKMLADSLQELSNDGLVRRVQYNEMPLRVEYSLTNVGKSLFPILCQITEWGQENVIGNN